MLHKVIKGVDDEIEFKGFKGRYFYQLATTIGVTLFLTFFFYTVGFSSIILLIISLITNVIAFVFIKTRMEKNGKWGHIHSQHTKRKPTYILHNQAFYRLIANEKSEKN